MLALGRRAEVEEVVNRLNISYQELLALSEHQLKWVEQAAENETFQDKFQELAEQWMKLQARITEDERQLRTFVSDDEVADLYKRIALLASQAKANIAQAETKLKQSLSLIGSSIRSASEHRQISKAYNSSAYDEHIPLFLDEKK